MGPRGSHRFWPSDTDVEEQGRHVLEGRLVLPFEDLHVLRLAEYLEMLVDAADAGRLTSIDQILGQILNSSRLARRSKPLIAKGTGKRL
jgi:hypothetical protein